MYGSQRKLPVYCRVTLCTAAALMALGVMAAQPAAAQNYSFQTVDAPGADRTAVSIFHSTWRNNPGLLVQQYFDSNPPVGWGHTAVLRAGAWSIIDVPGSIWCGASNPNPKGEVALTYASQEGAVHMAIWRDGSYTSMPDLHGYEMWGRGINNQGQVVGFAFDPAGNEHGFVRDGEQITFFDYPLAAPGTAAYAINDSGTVIGWYDAPDGTIQSFRRNGNQFETITPPGSVFCFALTINERGVIGGAYLDSDFLAHGFLLDRGTFRTVDVPGAAQTKIDCINDRGQIAGGYVTDEGLVHGFVATPVGK